jgi:outer membrane protein assembly factor BamB
MTHEKLPAGRVNDWPQQGVCSTPYVEGNRLYYTSNRATIVCLDTEGFLDSENDGPTSGEKDASPIDGDVIWEYDMIGDLDVFPHNLAVSSPLVVDGVLFATTGNGVDEGHINIPSPKAPSFIALDAQTGKLLWESNLPGDKIFHGTWSNPTYGVVKGKPQIIFPGGDGWIYGLEPKTGKMIWKFNANPPGSKYILGGRGTANEVIGTAVLHGDRLYVGVGQDPEHGEGVGNFWCIDATLEGDITDKGKVWHRGGNDFRRTISTVAIGDGIVYAADLSGFLYALDAATGQHYWTHDMLAAVWGSPFLADGRVYLGDEDGDLEVLKAGKTKQVLGSYNMGVSVYSTPVAKDGVLYVLARNRLFALQQGVTGKPATARTMESVQ